MGRAARGHIWKRVPISGEFACGSSGSGMEIMIELPCHEQSDRCRADRNLSRAERLEIISMVAAVEMSECSAWIIPMLERGGRDEDQRMEK